MQQERIAVEKITEIISQRLKPAKS